MQILLAAARHRLEHSMKVPLAGLEVMALDGEPSSNHEVSRVVLLDLKAVEHSPGLVQEEPPFDK